jgi:threonine dehydrogenase-like Zn-dependent dehydrogenase
MFRPFRENNTLQGGIAPVRAYIPELMDDVLNGTLDPSPVFDKTVRLEEVPDGYAAMDDREAVEVLIKL